MVEKKLDFLLFNEKTINKVRYLTPDFKINTRTKDIMILAGYFYAIWDFENECWTKNRDRAYELIDICMDDYVKREEENSPGRFNGVKLMYAEIDSSGVAERFNNFFRKKNDHYKPLDTKVVFKSDTPARELYSSHRLNYDPIAGPTPAYDKIISTLYSDEERQKIEWLIGAALCGDNDKVQKFGVFYGDPGTGKGTIMDIIALLFDGYSSAFEADALGRKSDAFALEPFKNHPVVAMQTDGNLSRIEDNTRLNTLIAHEKMTVNEKFKGRYDTRFHTILFIASNDPVKITNAKSGLLRRLIDIEPTGNTLPAREYRELKNQIPFELSGIAYRCMELYSNNKDLYDGYRPMPMMARTNEFYDFVLEYYDQFSGEEYILLSTAWTWYRKYIEDANAYSKLSRTNFTTELSSYFKSGPQDEWYIDEEGHRKHLSSVYRGFKEDKFKNVKGAASVVVTKKGPPVVPIVKTQTDIYDEIPEWLRLTDVNDNSEFITENPFDLYFAESKASYAVGVKDKTGNIPDPNNTKPKVPWDKCKTKLKSLDTTLEHYVHCQEEEPNLIFLDFDDVDPETGKKSLQRNLRLAKKFPKTYTETSRSGNGLHLYYIYDGDPGELSSLYDTHVEIKRLTGDSSLRRRLYLCNNLPIAHINSGLPLKEVKKKVLDEHLINDEKHLRNKIKKALRREVHANTRPSIDYIKMVLTEAYDSGMKYDVSDLRQSVMNFAAGSTNQAEYCMQVVLDLPFCSEEPSENVQTNGYLEKPIAFFDCEVFPNLFIVCYKVEGGTIGEDGKKEVVRMVNPTANDISDLVQKYRLIGFNNLKYDNHILYARILGYSNEQLYKLSQAIVSNDKNAGFRESKNISYTDIYDFSNTKQGLKKWEIELDINHQEFPLPWDQPVPEEMWDLAADYCANDVYATEVLFYSKKMKEDWNARQFLAKLSGLTVNDLTNTHSARIMFGTNRNPQSSFNYPDLSKEFPGYEFNQFGIDKDRYNIGPDGKSVKTTGKSIFMGDDPSEGGYVYYETGIHYNVALLDIASLHPSTIEAIQLFGPEYTARYSELKALRVAIKHKDWDTARGYLGGAITPFLEGVESLSEDEQQELSDSLSYALKIVLNSAYGMTSAPFANPFKDPRNVDNVVAKRGALFMIMLKHAVQKKGFTVAHVKTDSIKIPNATPEIIQFVMDMGKKYGYSFEHEATYTKMCLVNKSVYIAKYDEYGERTKGGKHANAWTHTGAEFQHPYIFKTLFSHEPITFKDYCETKSTSGGGAIYLDNNEKLTEELERELYSLKEDLDHAEKGKLDIRRAIKAKQEEIDSIHNLAFVGRCGLFTPVIPGVGGGYLLRVDGDKVGAISGTKGYRWMESVTVKKEHLEDAIDMSYFRSLVDAARDHIAEYGDAEEFING